MFINCSNHKSEYWSKEQIDAASVYGNIVDMSFPEVGSDSTEEDIAETAGRLFKQIQNLSPSCVMCQGEFTLTHKLVNMLIDAGIKTVAACSDRRVTEEKLNDGSTKKTVIYEFAGFRDYQKH